MKKIYFLSIILGFILTACNQEENVTDILDDPPILSVKHTDDDEEINQTTGVVCWGNCSNDDRGFGFRDIDDYTLNSLPINRIKENAVFQITHEDPQADDYGYFARIDKGDSITGYNTYIDSNEFQAFKDDGTYMAAAQWFDDKEELIGYVYSLYKVEVE